jgi:hypothetical protein
MKTHTQKREDHPLLASWNASKHYLKPIASKPPKPSATRTVPSTHKKTRAHPHTKMLQSEGEDEARRATQNQASISLLAVLFLGRVLSIRAFSQENEKSSFVTADLLR